MQTHNQYEYWTLQSYKTFRSASKQAPTSPYSPVTARIQPFRNKYQIWKWRQTSITAHENGDTTMNIPFLSLQVEPYDPIENILRLSARPVLDLITGRAYIYPKLLSDNINLNYTLSVLMQLHFTHV